MADDPNAVKPNPQHAKKLQMGQEAPKPKAAEKAPTPESEAEKTDAEEA